MAVEDEELKDEQGRSVGDDSSEALNLPGNGSRSPKNRVWFHVRLRTVVLSLVGAALGVWFVLLMALSEDMNPLDEPLTSTVLAFLVLWSLVWSYCNRFSRCPQCGEYALGEEGNHFVNFLKGVFSLSGHASYWEVCRNCGYREWHEVSDF